MKIEAGKYYLDAEGNKRGPMEKWNVEYWHVESEVYLWQENGHSYHNQNPQRNLIAEWTDEPAQPETGTLAELNVKPGDVVEWIGDYIRERDYIEYTIGSFDGKVYRAKGMPEYNNLNPSEPFRIISRASQSTTPVAHSTTPPSPVRTVTRKEIVPGEYGVVRVYHDESILSVAMDFGLSIAAIDQAIQTLTEIRDALESP